jgi:hypothetical protein
LDRPVNGELLEATGKHGQELGCMINEAAKEILLQVMDELETWELTDLDIAMATHTGREWSCGTEKMCF